MCNFNTENEDMTDKIIVTKADNVNEEGELIDSEAFGYLISEHMPQVTTLDAATGTIVTGVVPKVGVLWEHKRTPSPSYEDPETLHWLEIETDADDDDEITDTDLELVGEQSQSVEM